MKHDADKRYLEYFAKALLETLFPEIYYGLEKKESPDLWLGEDYGIEVTQAKYKNQGQAEGILNHIQGRNINLVDRRHICTMNRIQAKVLTKPDGKVCGYMPMDGQNEAFYDEIIEAYKKKRIKAHSYNKSTLDLFIYPPLAQMDGWLGKALIEECFALLSDDSENPFDHFIVYEEPTLYLYDVKKKSLLYRRGNREEILRCKMDADQYSGWSREKKDIKAE